MRGVRNLRPLPHLLSFLVLSAENLYISGFFLLQLYVGVIHHLIWPTLPVSLDQDTMAFLPLMLISVYCAVGILWAWLKLSWVFMR